MDETGQELTAVPNWVWWSIGVAIGFVITFWLGFGMMMELSPSG